MIRARFVLAALAVTALMSACSNDGIPTSPVSSHPAFQGGTGGGGSSTGGGSTGGGSTTSSATVGPPVAPTYVARIDTLGVVPAGLYYGTPSGFVIGGYKFTSAYLSSFKPVNGPITVGACVSVTFQEVNGVYMMSELKTLQQTKCG